jgi:hypothetical protein
MKGLSCMIAVGALTYGNTGDLQSACWWAGVSWFTLMLLAIALDGVKA